MVYIYLVTYQPLSMRSSHVSSLAVIVVGWTVILQHVLDDVTSGPASEHQLAVLEAHILRYNGTVGRAMFEWTYTYSLVHDAFTASCDW